MGAAQFSLMLIGAGGSPVVGAEVRAANLLGESLECSTVSSVIRESDASGRVALPRRVVLDGVTPRQARRMIRTDDATLCRQGRRDTKVNGALIVAHGYWPELYTLPNRTESVTLRPAAPWPLPRELEEVASECDLQAKAFHDSKWLPVTVKRQGKQLFFPYEADAGQVVVSCTRGRFGFRFDDQKIFRTNSGDDV